jgi:hypothetical protein
MKVHLVPSQFNPIETLLIKTDNFTIHQFKYHSGVEALRICIGRGELVWLPFFAQSIWNWKVDGVEQKFDGFVQEPNYGARDFLHNYGAFLIHCGITAMGNPTKEDNHLHHGELPLARYDEAWIEISDGPYPLSLCGTYRYHTPFIADYCFSPAVRIMHDGSSMFIDATLENLQNTPLQYMYLNHLNFSMKHAVHLEYGINGFTKETVTILDETIAGVKEDPSLLLRVEDHPDIHPELVAIFKNQPQFGPVCVHKMHRDDGTVVWVAANVESLDHTVVWLTSTPDRSACGFSLPATAGPRGLAEETRCGNVKTLGAKDMVVFQFVFGLDKRMEEEKLHKAIKFLGGFYD